MRLLCSGAVVLVVGLWGFIAVPQYGEFGLAAAVLLAGLSGVGIFGTFLARGMSQFKAQEAVGRALSTAALSEAAYLLGADLDRWLRRRRRLVWVLAVSAVLAAARAIGLAW